jgi:uncharacterized membrane protein YphA (DoxX/SURF4 family)
MREEASDLLLRLGTALAFLYPSIDGFLNPFSWVGYLPPFLVDVIPEMIVLHAFGIIGIILAIWILSGRNIFVPSLAATAFLLLNVITNASEFEVLFRDLAIAAMTLALAVRHRPHRRVTA